MSWNSRTNRILIKWVNHNGWLDIFVIKKLFFLFIFSTYLPVFLLKFQAGELIGESNKYPHYILLMDPATPKTRNTWKNVMMTSSSHFFRYFFCFWGSGVHQKYAVWVLVGCGIKFHIQRDLPIEIWVKTQGDMSKIRTQKVVFFFLPPKLINIILLF